MYLQAGLSVCLKVSGYTSKGSNSVIFIFVSIFNMGQLLKEMICSLRSKFFPLGVDPILEELGCPGNQTSSHESCSP